MTNRGSSFSTSPFSVLATVDSGASRSFFPVQIALALGLDLTNELTRDPGRSVGVRSESETWSPTVPIMGQVIAHFAGQSPQPFGPVFPLQPAFATVKAFLLWRADFFRAFIVTFEEDAATPAFHLDWS